MSLSNVVEGAGSLDTMCDETGAVRLRLKKRGPVRQGAQPEMPGQRLADIGEAVAPAERARHDAGPEGEHRDMLARVIGAAPARIAAVIGSDDGEIALPQPGAEARQRRIERGERGGIALDIAAMAVERVEIVEI